MKLLIDRPADAAYNLLPMFQDIEAHVRHVWSDYYGKPLCFDCLANRARLTKPPDLFWLRAFWQGKKHHARREFCPECRVLKETILYEAFSHESFIDRTRRSA